MKNFIFSIEDLIVESKYNSLKKEFKRFDEFYTVDEVIKIDNPFIETYNYLPNDDGSSIQSIAIKFFIEDFVLPGIKKIKLAFIDQLNIELNEKYIFKPTAKEDFYKTKLNQIIDQLELIERLDHLPSNVKMQLNNVLLSIIDYIKEQLKNPFPKIYNKLNVNCTRAEIEAFFYQLFNKGIINNATPGDLGKVIDNCFKYLEKENEYKDINDSNKHISAFQTDDRGFKAALKKLYKRYSKIDFFNT